MANYYLNKDGSITRKQKTGKENKKQQSQLNYNRQVSEKIKQQRSFKDQLSKPVDYKSYTTDSLRQERNKLQNQMLRYDGTKDSKGNYTLKGILDTFTGQSRKKLAKDKTYQTAQERLNQLNSILEQRFEEERKGKSKIENVAFDIANKAEDVTNKANVFAEEVRQNPLETLKTAGVGLGEGLYSGKNAIQNSLVDLGNALSFGQLQNNLMYQDTKRQIDMSKLNDPFKETKTYKKLEEGKLSPAQSTVFNVGQSIGGMVPAMAVTAVTGSPTAGSAVFYAQAQDNYYNEAKQRGYDEKQARLYSLGMAGVETLVERLGFDEIGGLPEGSIVKAMLGEGAEEYVTPYIDAVFRKYGFKEDVDFKDVNKEAIEGALMGGLTGGIMQLAGNGFAKVDAVANKIGQGVEVSPVEIQEAIQEVQEVDPQFVDNMLSEAAENLDEQTIEEVKKQMNLNQTSPNTTEQVEQQNIEPMSQQDAKIEENASKEKTTSEVASKEEPPKAKVSKPLNFREALTDYEMEDILQQINTYNQEQIEKNLITTERVKESYNNNNINLAYATLVMKNNKASDFSQTRAENYFKSLSKKLSDTDKNYIYRNLDKTNPKLAEMAEKYFAPKNTKTESNQETVVEEKLNKSNYNIPEAKNPDKIVTKITENMPAKEKEQTEKLLAEPGKNKTTVDLGDGRTVTTPSEKTREGGIEAASKYLKNSVSQRETKDIEVENKKRRGYYDNIEKMYESQGNTDMVEYIKKLKENDLYTVEHSGKKVFDETIKLLEDPENYYKKYNESIDKLDSKDINSLKQLEYQQVAMLRYFGDINSPGYNPTIAADISTAFAQEGTNIAQAMATRRQMFNDSPQQIAIRTQQTLNSLFREEAEKHEGDTDWLNKNDPLKNPESPYRMTDSNFAYINHEANVLDKIQDKTSTEYLETYAQLNNYIQSLFGDKKITDKMKRLTITNVLASSRIWVQNIKGNFVNLAQFNGIDKLWGTGIDKIISKDSDIRTIGMSFEGDVIQGIKAYKQGIADSFYELKHDVSISKFHSKYTDSQSTDISNLGKKSFGKTFNDDSKVGHALNRYQDFVNFALDIGDRPFANMYYEQSIYNQRMLNAQLDAEDKKTNVIYNVNFNEKNGNYKVRYFDENGQKITTVMNEKQYNDFSNKAVVEEITETMCNIAEKEALEKTYQDDNRITRAALKMKDSLNEIFHVGDYGFGDMILKFTRTGSNMAKALYEHSPLEAIQLTKDIRALKRNTDAGTVSAELQHKVASEAGKLLGGVTTMAIIGALDWSGILKIEGQHDKDKEDKFKESTMGSQEYSFTLPGGNYKYKISNDSTIGSLARLGKTAEDLLQETNSALDMLFGMTNPFVNSLIDNSFMSSVLDLGNSYSDPVDNLAKKIAAQPSNLIPSALKDISFAIDNFEERNTYDDNLAQYMINQIINKTPLRGSDLDIDTPIAKIRGLSGKTTAWGEVKTVGGDTLASFWNTFLTGDTLSKIKNDKISNEVVDVYANTNNSKAIPNLTTTKNFKYNGQQYDLNEKEQNKYMTAYGKTSYKAVQDLMNTNQYKNATDDQKVKLLEKAYSYAREQAMSDYLKSKGETYYNYKKKDGKYTEYKKSVFEEIIENDISIEDATYKRKYNNSYKLKTSITDLENYQDIAKDIKEIKQAYKNYPYKTQKYAVQSYINGLQGLNTVQKAMISKLEHSKSDYANYDDKILQYIRSLKLSDEEYQYMYKELGLGGYWSMYYKTKKKR